MGIHVQHDEKHDLTIFTLEDGVSVQEIEEVIERFWTDGPMTMNVMWKGSSRVSIAHLGGDDLRQVSRVVGRFREMLKRRKGGRTAIVAPADIDFGLSRIIEALHLNMIPEPPFTIRVFRNESEALSWIEAGSDPVG